MDAITSLLGILPLPGWLALLFFVAACIGYTRFATRRADVRPSVRRGAARAASGAVTLRIHGTSFQNASSAAAVAAGSSSCGT